MSVHGPASGVLVRPLGRSSSHHDPMRKPLHRLQSQGATKEIPSQETAGQIVDATTTAETKGIKGEGIALRQTLDGRQMVDKHQLFLTELHKLQPNFTELEHALMFATKSDISQLTGLLRCTMDATSGMNLLHKASQAGSLITVITILDSRSSVDVESSLGRSALHYACDNDHKDVVKALICRQANVNQKTPFGMTPLHIACYSNAVGSVLVLLSQRKQFVEIDHEDERRRTPLMLARNEVVRWMVRDYRESLGSRSSELVRLCRDGRKPKLTKREERDFGKQLVDLAWKVIHEPQSKLLPQLTNGHSCLSNSANSLPVAIQLNCICPFLGIQSTSSDATSLL